MTELLFDYMNALMIMGLMVLVAGTVVGYGIIRKQWGK